MPIRSSALALRGDIVRITLDFGEDGDLNVDVRPRSLTHDARKQIAQALGNNDWVKIADLLLPTIVSWDLMDEAGQFIPVSTSGMDDLPIAVIAEILKQTAFALSLSSRVSAQTGAC